MSRMESPVIFCMGWRSYWCVLDEAMHILRRFLGEDECGWICEKHDRALLRYWDRRPAPAAQTAMPTITVNPSWTSGSNATFTWKQHQP